MSPGALTIRRDATPAEAPLVFDFVRRLATYERQPERVTATPEAMGGVLLGTPPLCRALLAWLDARAVGLAGAA